MLKPLKKKIIVELIEKERTTTSGILLSSADPHEVSKGLVLAIGSDVEEVKVGDYILPNWNKAPKTVFEGQDFYVVDEEDVVLIFGDENT
jgi:chaperonin GroES